MTQYLNGAMARRLFSTRKIVHVSMLVFALLLPFLTWIQAAGCAVLALLFNVLILPRLALDLDKRPLKADLGVGAGAGQLDEAPPRPDWVAEGLAGIGTGIILYPISVLGLILIYRRSIQVVAAVWAIMALGDGMASVVGEAVRGPALPYNRGKTWSGFLGFIIAGTAGAYALTRWVAPSLPEEKILLVSAATAVVGALVETLPIRLDDNLTVPLVCGGFMFCAYLMERAALASNLPYLGRRLLLGGAVNLLFALVAWGLEAVNRSGAAVGFLVGVAVYLGYGYKSFLILAAFVVMGSVATRLGYAKKQRRGIAEGRGGARGWREVLANSLAGAFFAVLVVTTRYEAAFLLAFLAVFAEAAGDTVSSEIGQWLSDRAYLITTLRPVPAGENGGISFGGCVAGLAASAAVVVLGYGLGLCGMGGAGLALAAAVAGNLLDSVLGATIERRGLVTNGMVNFTGTSLAGALALGVALHSYR
jgi:uncharacterized protein (TIGR00297 family)